MHRVRMIIHFGATPYLVFDGGHLPSKAETEEKRALKRAESRRKGEELHRMGKKTEAFQELQKAVDVTPEIARQLIEELKRHNIRYVVAPYEADAQLAYLEKRGIIQGVVSEDSDLLVFGVRRLITKLDNYGECIEINRKDFAACREVSLVNWSDTEFRQMAILSGCDYLSNFPGFGLKTAYRHIQRYKNIERVIQILQLHPKFKVPPDYRQAFQKAEEAFLHQRVFCPQQQKVVMLNNLDNVPEDFDHIGQHVEQLKAIGIARGDIHPMTKDAIVWNQIQVKNLPSPWTKAKNVPVATPLKPKSEKSIDFFMKPKRVPLAELDPNSFTPSPSQQRLLNSHPSSVASTPVSTSTNHHSIASASSARVSQIPRSRQSLASIETSASKRLRLCDDAGESDLAKVRQGQQSTEKSRFFAAPFEQSSPCIGSRPKGKKASNFEIWSGPTVGNIRGVVSDSGEGLPGTDQKPRTQKISVFTDPIVDLKQRTQPTLGNRHAQDTHAPPTAAPNKVSSTPKWLPPTSPSHAPVGLDTSEAHASLIQPSLAEARLRAALGLRSRSSGSSQEERHPASKKADLLPVSKQRLLGRSLPETGSMTSRHFSPAGGAFTSGRKRKSSAGSPCEGTPHGDAPESLLDKSLNYNSCVCDSSSQPQTRSVTPPESASRVQEEEPEEYPHMPESPLHPLRGSEDAIVPDSEDNEEGLNSDEEPKRGAKPQLDFASFLFRQ